MDHRHTNLEATCPPPPSFIDALIHPTDVFAEPKEVLEAAHLSLEAKRAILASWASHAWAVESRPALRHCPGLAGRMVPLDSILAALRTLDEASPPTWQARRAVRWLTGRGQREGVVYCWRHTKSES